MFFKLLLAGIVVGVGVYYYDLNTAQKVIKDAKFSSIETDTRCQNAHETMCKYYLTVKLGSGGRDQTFYKFEVPWNYYHIEYKKEGKPLTHEHFRVIYKMKKILPARIIGLEPKYQAKLDKELVTQRDNDM